MNPGELLQLKAELGFLLTAAQEIHKTIDRLGQKLQPEDPQEEVVMAIGLNLMHYYSALEDILAHITAVFDAYKPSGPDWHRGLLQLATVATSTRPPILSSDTYEALDAYRRFHHVVRKAYLQRLEWSRMQSLVDQSGRLLSAVAQDLARFIAFLDEAIRHLLQEG